MTFRSKLLAAGVALLGAALAGCSSGAANDTAEPPMKKADPSAAALQQGENGKKAAVGGGEADFGIVPAKPGEETGVPVGGRK